MGYPTQQQKVDYLFKKIGFTKTKTGVAEDQTGFTGNKKAPPNEAIASPLVVPSSSLWSDSSLIPATPPTSNTAHVGIYTSGNAYHMSVDTTVSNNRTFIARETWWNPSSAIQGDWIDTQFGADYLVKVYMGDPSGISTNLSAAGTSGKDDVWFFDYSSGVLNFNGEDLDGQLTGITTSNVYIVGYRYTGGKGAKPPAGIGTFTDLNIDGNLTVGGISTFSGLIDANGIIEGIAGQNKIPSLYANYSDLPNAGTYHGMFAHVHSYGRGYFAHAGAWMELVNKEVNGVVGTGTERYNIGPVDATSLKITGITTLGNIGISTGKITGPAITYIDPATVGAAGTVVILGDLQVDGTQTTVNSSTMTVTDKNIELAKGAANDAAANTGGITVKSGDGDKTWQWLDATDSWTSSEHIRLAAGKVYGFSADTNTYITNYQPDSIEMTTGGVERFELKATNSGNSTVLTISDDGNNGSVYGGTGVVVHGSSGARIKFAQNSLGYGIADGFEVGAYDGGAYFINREPQDIFFSIAPNSSSNPSELVRIKSDGKVGIGTDNPVSKLDVRGNLNVTGVTTAVTVDVNGDLDVDGHTNLDNVSIAGVTTVANNTEFIFGTNSTNTDRPLKIKHQTSNARNQVTADYIDFNVRDARFTDLSNNNCIAKFWNSRVILCDGNGNDRLETKTNGVEITGLTDTDTLNTGDATFTGNIDANGDLDVDGQTELDDVSISGVTTATGTLRVGTGHTFHDNGNAQIAGIATVYNQLNIPRFYGSGNPTTQLLTLGADEIRMFQRWNGSTSTIEFKSTGAFIGHPATGAAAPITIQSGSFTRFKFINSNGGSGTYAEFNKSGTGGYVQLHGGANTKVLTTDDNGVNILKDLDVDGHTELQGNLSVTGISTFSNTTFTGTISAGSTTGTDGYYLKSTGIGVTWAVLPSSRTTSTQTATAGQTSFNFAYNVGFVDVFLNGVKLPSSEFTATNGSTIVLDDAAFANDTLEFISLNTVPVSSGGGASNLDGLSDVNITSPVAGQALRYNGVKFVNDYHPHLTTTSTSQVSITNLPIASYRSAEYLIQVTEGTKYHVTKIIAIHDGTNVTFNEYGTITTSTSLATFTLDINSGSMRLLATPASTNSTTFKVKFDAIAV